jgi:hypothetical protein
VRARCSFVNAPFLTNKPFFRNRANAQRGIRHGAPAKDRDGDPRS